MSDCLLTRPTLPSNGLLPGFLGLWHARRKVVDHGSRKSFTFRGVATITPEQFLETGEMMVDGRSMSSRRLYRLEMGADAISVQFENRRPFIQIDDRPRQDFVHFCGDDTYKGRILVSDFDRWLELWRVSGPRKRYSSMTCYVRMNDGTAYRTSSRC